MRLALIASCLVALLPTAQAAASIDEGTYTVVNPEVSVPAPGTEGGFVSCPAGQRIVAQGMFWHLPAMGPDPANALSGNARMGSDTPTSDGLGMFSSGENGVTARFRQSVLLCLPDATIGTPYTTVITNSPPVMNTNAGGYTPCPAGQRVVSGGAFWHADMANPVGTDADTSWIGSSSPTTDGLGWYADGNNASATARVFTTIIHCLPTASFGPYTIVQPDSAEIPDAATTGGFQSCPAGQRIVTGGAFWHVTAMGPTPPNAAGVQLSSSTPTTDGLGWYADGLNGSGVGNYRLTTVLLCVTPKLPAPPVTPTPITPTPAVVARATGQRAAALAKCKKKKSKKARKKCKKRANKLPA